MEIQKFEKNRDYIIRANNAGVFMGKIAFINGKEIGVTGIRRLYYWSGALDVTQLALEGVANPDSCKFSVKLGDSDLSILSDLTEYHPMSEVAVNSINSVKVWKS